MSRFLPSASKMPGHTFLFTFLVCGRLFIKPHKLLERLLQRARELFPEASRTGSAPVLAVNFTSILREWTETCAYDFRDARMIGPMKELTELCAMQAAESNALVADLQQALLSKLGELEMCESRLKREYELQIKTKTETIKNGAVSLHCLMNLTADPELLAYQLLYIEQERFKSIGPEEFIQTFIKDEDDVRLPFYLLYASNWMRRLKAGWELKYLRERG